MQIDRGLAFRKNLWDPVEALEPRVHQHKFRIGRGHRPNRRPFPLHRSRIAPTDC